MPTVKGATSSDTLLARLGMPEVALLLEDVKEHPHIRALLSFAITGRELTDTDGLWSIQTVARNLHVGLAILTAAMQRLGWLDKDGRVSNYAISAGFMEIKFWPVKEAMPSKNYRKYERFFMTRTGVCNIQDYISTGTYNTPTKKEVKGRPQPTAKKTDKRKRNKSQLYNQQQYIIKRAEIAQIMEARKRRKL